MGEGAQTKAKKKQPQPSLRPCDRAATAYRSEDPLGNLKIRVQLKSLSVPTNSEPQPEREPAAEEQPNANEDNEEEEEAEQGEDPIEDAQDPQPEVNPEPKEDPEERGIFTGEFQWQEKRFSKREVATIRRGVPQGAKAWEKVALKQKTDELSRDEHEVMSEKREQGLAVPAEYEGSVLFTYVEGDEWEDEEWEAPISGVQAPSTRAAARLRDLGSSKKVVTMTKLEKHLYLDKGYSRMRIMATLPSEDPEGDATELALCVMRGYKVKHGTVLEMRPGFNTEENPTYKVIHNGAVYELSIALASDLPDDDDLDFDRERRKKERADHRRLLSNRSAAGKEEIFKALPPEDKMWSVMMQLHSAHDFDSPNVYVEFQWTLPSWWNASVAEEELRGTSQIAECVYDRSDWFGRHPSFHLGIGHEYEITESPGPAAGQTAMPLRTCPANRPQLFFRVCSLDSWQRFRLLGYGVVPMPEHPGRRCVTLRTWRPADDRHSRLRSFFVGGSNELTNWCPDVSMPNTDRDFDGKYLNKFGAKTQSSGTLEVEINLMCRGAPPKPASRGIGRGPGGRAARTLFGGIKRGAAGRNIVAAARRDKS